MEKDRKQDRPYSNGLQKRNLTEQQAFKKETDLA